MSIFFIVIFYGKHEIQLECLFEGESVKSFKQVLSFTKIMKL